MKNYLIIGNSAAGTSAAEAIRKNDGQGKITIITDEEYPVAYYRCLISYLLSGEISEDRLSYRGLDFYKEKNIELILNKKVIKVDPKKNRVSFLDNTKLEYDSLLIATGSSPAMPDIKGTNKRGVFGFRTIKDTKEILEIAPIAEGACVLGGGLIGIKAAYGLKKKGLEVKIIVKSNQILSQVVDKQAGDLIQEVLEENGIEILTGRDVTEIIGNGDAKAVKLDTGKVLASSIVIVGKGVEPNIDLVKDTEIKTEYGILVGRNLATNIPNIFAAGDVCQANDLIQGGAYINALWPNAIEQGKISGQNLSGANLEYDGSVSMNAVDFFGLAIVSMGIKRSDKPGFEELSHLDREKSVYRKITLKENRVVGMVSVGDVKNSGIFLRLMKERIDISDLEDRLLDENFSYASIMDRVKEKDQMYLV
ncbi:MAG: FAD-dependent oxidoreductase [Candidatus Omnitrophota bacterium]